MPLRNAHAGNAVASPNNCIWVSDQLLSSVFARFTAAVYSSKDLEDVTCLRQYPKPALSSRQSIRAPHSPSIGRRKKRRNALSQDSRRTTGANSINIQKHTSTHFWAYRAEQSSEAHLRTPLSAFRLLKSPHSHHGPRQHEQRRHTHNVPGPLEARRRLNRRRFNLATGGVQAGGSFVMDYEVMFNSMWGRPKQPYWEWQAPTRKTIPQGEREHVERGNVDMGGTQIEKRASSLPHWLTYGFDFPYNRPAAPKTTHEVVSEPTIETEVVDESSITASKEFRMRFATIMNVKEVTELYYSLDTSVRSDPAVGAAASQHMVHCYLHHSTLDESSSETECRIVDFAHKSGCWSSLMEHLCGTAKILQYDEASISLDRMLLSLLNTALRHAMRTNLEVLPLLKALDAVAELVDTEHDEHFVVCEEFVDRALNDLSHEQLEQIINTAQHMQSNVVAMLFARNVVRSITNIKEKAVFDVRLGPVLRPLAWILESSSLTTAGQRLVELAHEIYSDILSWPDLTTTPQHLAVSHMILRLAVDISDIDPTTEVVSQCAERVLRELDVLDDYGMEQYTLDMLNRYAQKLLSRESASAATLEGTFPTTQPLVARLLDAVSIKTAHTWYSYTSYVLIDRYTETRDTSNIGLLNLWGKWAACSKQIRDQQRELKGADVQNFYFKLLSVFKPSEVPHTLHLLPPHQLCQVLLRHYLVRIDVQDKNPTSTMFGSSTYADLRNHFMRAFETMTGVVFSSQARTLEAVAETFESQARHMTRQREREIQIAREDNPSTWICLEYDAFTGTRNFGAILYDERALPLSKADTYNKQQKILKTHPAGILPYLSLLTAMKEHNVSSKVISHLLLEILQIFSATKHYGWISHLTLATQSHLDLTLTSDVLSFIAGHIQTYASIYPSESLGLFNKLRTLPLGAIPNLIPALIASNRSKLHPRQIMPLFFYHERDILPNGAEALYDRDDPSRPLSPCLISQIHDAALAFARASRFSTKAAWDCIYRLYRHLQQRSANIDDRMSRALVIAGVLRPIRDGTCYKIPEAKFRFILQVVTELESEEIADRIDETARKAETREGVEAWERRRMLRRRMPRSFDGRPGEELGPRLGDFEIDTGEIVGDGRDEKEKGKPGWKQRQRARERRAGVEPGQLWDRREERGTWSGFRYI